MSADTSSSSSRHRIGGSLQLPASSTRQQMRRLRRVQRMARMMDSSFKVPGTPIKFGWDSIVGLVPGVGDLVSVATGAWLLREAYGAGVTRGTLVKMVGNIAVDATVGTVPLVGDVFDVFWKANLRNARLLEKHLSD